MKKTNKNSNNVIKITIAVIAFIIILSFVIYILYNNSNNETLEEFNKEGFDSTKQDLFYKKILTNNTLEDFYKDMANKKDSEYQEFYFSKDSTEYIELKMIYKNGISTSLNITNNLQKNETNYNYELSYKTAHLLIEGNSNNDYECQIIKNNNVSTEIAKKYCDMIQDEIIEFNDSKEDLLKNEKIRALIKK